MQQFSIPALIVLLGSGCGTIENLNADSVPFGGAKYDIDYVMHGSGKMPVEDALVFRPIAALDTPVSLVGDLITLPMTLDTRWNSGGKAGRVVGPGRLSGTGEEQGSRTLYQGSDDDYHFFVVRKGESKGHLRVKVDEAEIRPAAFDVGTDQEFDVASVDDKVIRLFVPQD
jgi:uncharacterized protein YceK